MRWRFLGALFTVVLVAMPTLGRAQTHDAHPPASAPAPPHEHSTGSGAGDSTPHEGMQYAGESPAEMMWSMYTDLGNRAYQHGLYGEAEKTFKSALKEA